MTLGEARTGQQSCDGRAAAACNFALTANHSWQAGRGLPLSKDGSLEHQLIAQGEVCHLKVLQQLIHDLGGSVGVAHGEQQVEPPAPDADVGVLQTGADAFLMPVHDSKYQMDTAELSE